MRRARKWIFIAIMIWITGGPYLGQAKADDVQVNSYTTGGQLRPSVAVAANGDFVVIWESQGSGETDASGLSIQGQRYASAGSRLGGEFQVNTYTMADQQRPSVAAVANGDFVVVWESFGSGGTDVSESSIQGQRYASDGSSVGSQFQVNTYTTSRQFSAAVGRAANGDFVVVWVDYGAGGYNESLIQAQRYASDGSAIGEEFRVNSIDGAFNSSPSVAVAVVGDFVVVWDSYTLYAENGSIQGQRYASDGTAAGAEFQVNTYLTNYVYLPSVAMDSNGDFVVVWAGLYATGQVETRINGQRYASNGARIGGEFQANAFIPNRRHWPEVAMTDSGDFVVVWEIDEAGDDTSERSIQARRYLSDGSPVGVEFQVECYTADAQRRPSVAADAAGNFVVVWDSNGSGGTDSSGTSIQKTLGALIFADGFESGDTSSWSSTTTP